jgi:5-methylcytosine-specific restriction endonuclease McrA
MGDPTVIVASWGASYNRAKRFGLRCEARMPAMDGEQSRQASAALSEMYWRGLIDRDERNAASEEIDRASHSFWVRGKVEYVPRKKSWSRKIVAELLQRDGGDCWLCGKRMPEGDRSIEHHLAVSLGGTDDLDNLRLTHRLCNFRLGNMPPAEKEAMRAEWNATPSMENSK